MNKFLELQFYDFTSDQQFLKDTFQKECSKETENTKIGCFVLFDLSDMETLESVSRWKKLLASSYSSSTFIPCVLIANKVS